MTRRVTLTLLALALPAALLAAGHGSPGGAGRPLSRAEALAAAERDRDAATFARLNLALDELAAYLQRHRGDFTPRVYDALRQATAALDRAVEELRRAEKERKP